MCIAIVNQPNSFLTKKQLKNAWDNNNHGAGIAYVDNGKVMTYHEGYNFDDFFEEYEFIRELTDTPILIHFRIATHGKGKDMLHPHSVTEGRVSLIHNGVISGLGDHKVSDTREFAQILAKFYPDNVDFIDHAGIRAMALTILGKSNKVAFLDWRGEVRILNDQLGHYDADGNWFSNDSYKRVNDYVWAGSKKVYKAGAAAKPVAQPTFWDSERKVAIPKAPKYTDFLDDDFDDEPSYKWNASKHELRSEYLRGTLDEDGIW
jgi:predicted glutamine amidotransferase